MNEAMDPDFEVNESAARSSELDSLRAVAKWQRAVIFALLANITMNIVWMAMQEPGLGVTLLLLTLTLVVLVIAVSSIFMLARELYDTGPAILCALLMFVPCISLITLLVVNQKATAYLQEHGVKVGFMGANPNSI